MKGAAPKLSESCSPQPRRKAQGALRSGRGHNAKPLVVPSWANIRDDVRQNAPRLRGIQTPLKEEALRARRRPLGQDGSSARNGYISHNLLGCFLSLSMTSHLFSPHTIIPAPEENPSRLMAGKCFVLAS